MFDNLSATYLPTSIYVQNYTLVFVQKCIFRTAMLSYNLKQNMNWLSACLSFFSSSQRIYQNKFCLKNLHSWIRTADLWCLKRPPVKCTFNYGPRHIGIIILFEWCDSMCNPPTCVVLFFFVEKWRNRCGKRSWVGWLRCDWRTKKMNWKQDRFSTDVLQRCKDVLKYWWAERMKEQWSNMRK